MGTAPKILLLASVATVLLMMRSSSLAAAQATTANTGNNPNGNGGGTTVNNGGNQPTQPPAQPTAWSQWVAALQSSAALIAWTEGTNPPSGKPVKKTVDQYNNPAWTFVIDPTRYVEIVYLRDGGEPNMIAYYTGPYGGSYPGTVQTWIGYWAGGDSPLYDGWGVRPF